MIRNTFLIGQNIWKCETAWYLINTFTYKPVFLFVFSVGLWELSEGTRTIKTFCSINVCVFVNSWVCTYLMQLNPLIGPQLSNTTIYVIQQEWAKN